MNPSEIKKLVELVYYQEGVVASRTVISKEVGTATVFAFDKEQGLSEHMAPFDALVFVVEGEARIKISGKEYNLKGGEMIIMPAGEPHSLKAIEKFKMLLVMIKGK